ncbi:MAG: methionine--tRNA ligase [Nitrospinota bacterium]|nr:methionine--tRNA ligase [Nitrospinota bacterium]
MNKKYYVTTPIYYVNDKPHIGHVYTTVAADVLARYQRLEGSEAFFLTGTDEHGQKADQAAKDKGQDTKAHVDFHSEIFRKLWKDLEISNDDFIRTTDKRHTSIVQKVLQELFDRGEIYSDSYKGWYCVPDERFWTEKDLVAGNCPDCGRKVEKIEEKNYFFRMSKYQDWLIQYIKDNEDFIGPLTRRNEVLGYLDKKLEDLCISRPKTRMSWGIELPFDTEFVAYVWFDALQNYITAPGYKKDDSRFNGIWPADFHLIGKDILITHTVYWSTMLKAMGLPLPKRVFAHGWWTVEGKKMSKSLGNVVEPMKVVEAVGIEPFRYFLMREVPFGQDGDFSVDALINRINVDLANNFGNLVSRTLSMIVKYRGGIVPPCSKPDMLEKLKFSAESAERNFAEHLKIPLFNRALEEVITLCDTVNKFIVEMEPWSLAKNEAKGGELDTVLYGAAESLRIIGRLLMPFMPSTARTLLSYIGIEKGHYGTDDWGGLESGTSVKEGEALFPRIDEKRAEEIKEALMIGGSAVKKEAEKSGEGLIDVEDFRKVELRTGVVLEAENVPKSKKLLKLQVDIGSEKRQIVAGIAESYTPEEVVGKRVVVVTNLKPAKLMGVESRGMLLAAHNEGKLSLICTMDEMNGGLKVS